MISKTGARYMTLEIKDFYLNTPMKRSEYMYLRLRDLPKYFIKQYKLTAKTTKDGYVYIKICKYMYRVPQARIQARKLL